MNELRECFVRHPAWSEIFSEADRLVVASIVRYAQRVEPSTVPLTEEDDGVVAALLLLAKSVRFDHAALSLRPVELEELLRTQLGGRLVDDLPGAHALRLALQNTSRPLVRAAIDRRRLDEDVSPAGPPVVISDDNGDLAFCHVRRLAYAEWRVAAALLTSAAPRPGDWLGDVVATCVAHLDGPAADLATAVARQKITVLTGGPGTGKTTAVARLLAELSQHAAHQQRIVRVAIAAPTAKAAVRLREALSDTVTDDHAGLAFHERSGSVHRLLGLRPDTDVATHELDDDLVIVDEVSMLELDMMDTLLSACGAHTRLLLVGDADQLASVNVGAVLRDIVEAADAGLMGQGLVRLTENFRSSSDIVTAAQCVNRGDTEGFLRLCETSSTVSISSDRRHDLARLEEHADHLRSRAASGDEVDTLRDATRVVVLCATRHGAGSVQWWQTRVGRDAPEFAVGTPLLITRNEEFRPDGSALANGDVGVVMETTEGPYAVFGPPDAPRRRPLRQLYDAEPAWAITIHKSQGSEYDDVVVSLPDHDVSILTRELVYTALTRARHHVKIVSSVDLLATALSRRIARVSGLSERMAALAEPPSE